MSVIDAIKNSVLENFDTTLSSGDILAGLAVAIIAGLFILLVYKFTMQQVTFNRSFCVSLLLVSVISAMMVLTITSNLALSLGMVGALSIIRFRTAIKDASDTAFLFWSVAAGITAGAGYYMLTMIGCLAIGLVCLLSTVLFNFIDKPYLLVVRAGEDEAVAEVEAALRTCHIRFSLSSLVENGEHVEMIYELAINPRKQRPLAALREIEGVYSISIVDCRKS